MNAKNSFILALVFLFALPLSANNKKKDQQRAMLEKMDAVPCGASQKGLSGLGSLWASVGITHMSSNEKLCPQYLIKTDEMEYEIRPTDLKHAVLLPVGQEAVIKVKKNRIMLRAADSDDHKMRSYEVVGMSPTPTNANSSDDRSPSSYSDDDAH